jgi:hypothetical protein
VSETAATLYGAQHPGYDLRLSGTGHLVLTQLSARKSAFEFPAELDRVLLIDAVHGTVAAEVLPQSARRVVVVPGPYLVRAWRGSRALTARLKLAPGQFHAVALDELAEEPPAAPERSSAPARPDDDRPLSGARGGCTYRCLYDAKEHTGDCSDRVLVIASLDDRAVFQIELPSKKSRLRLKFEVCNPSGLWLDLGDSPGCDGGGGDHSQFSNDAELEVKGRAMWVYANDYGRAPDGRIVVLGSSPAFVPTSGCVERSIVVGDGTVRGGQLDITSEYALRLDPTRDDEGPPDRRWYLGVNRSIGSAEPARSGSGLSWIDLCIQ